MNRLSLAALAAAVVFSLSACGPKETDCTSTGCSAGSTCNPTSGQCELPSLIGGGTATGGGSGGGTTTGGGTGTGGGSSTGGGSANGGGGPEVDAGIDAGPVVDPFDDGGVFVPGDICSNAIAVDFDGGTTAVLDNTLADATHQYVSNCGSSSAESNDVLYAVTLTQPQGLVVSVTDTTAGQSQDLTVSLVASPCPTFNQVACVDTGADTEVLTAERLPAGTWYVLIENYSDSRTPGSFSVQFELIDPAPEVVNDQCSGATPLVFTNDVATASGTTVGTLSDNTLTCSSASSRVGDVFYTFTTTQLQDVRVEVTPTGTPVLEPGVAVLRGCGGASLRCNASDPSDLTLRSLPAGTYTVVVDGTSAGSTGAFDLKVTLSAPTPVPTNDTCAMPATLVPNMSVMVNANDASPDFALDCSSGQGGDVVYTFTTQAEQRVKITATSVNGSDAIIALRADCAVNTDVKCTDGSGASEDETLTVSRLPAGTYYVIVQAYRDTLGEFGVQLELSPPNPPITNESCAAPLPVLFTAGPVTASVDLTEATADIDLDCAAFADGTDVVYEVTIPAMQTLTVTATPDAVLDPVLAVYQPMCSMPMADACMDDGGAGDEEVLTVPNTTAAPLTVFIVLKAYNDSSPGEAQLTFAVQ